VDPWDRGDGWRLNGPERGTSTFEIEGRRWDASAASEGGGVIRMRAGDLALTAQLIDYDAAEGGGEVALNMDGRPRDVTYVRMPDLLVLFVDGEAVELRPPSGDGRTAVLEAGDDIAAPMPGRVIEVRAGAGDAVAAGDVVLVLEAMKMEHALRAPRAGALAEVLVAAGDQVALGETLARLAPADAPS
jgi:3-methylcrotonyl-CoA carboxylase alpha subunit